MIFGCFGNPKSDEIIDARQSSPLVFYFHNIDVYKNLKNIRLLILCVIIYKATILIIFKIKFYENI